MKQVAKTVVINPQGQILLLKRGPTAPTRALKWDLPGGIIDDGEEPERTAVREIKEETGLELRDLKFAFGAQKAWGFYWHIYTAHTDKTEVTISWEHDAYLWVKPSEISHLSDMPKFLEDDILQALKAK